jgi:hypothetical protein
MTAETREQERTHLGRRSLVRAGVWAVPVVGVAVAAPALAVSGPTSNLTTSTTASSWNNGQQTFTITVTLRNTGDDTKGLALSLSGVTGTIASATTPAGWTKGTGFTYTSNAQIPTGGTLSVVFTITMSAKQPESAKLTFTTTNTGGYAPTVSSS